MKVLVTGGAGFIGRATARQLIANGDSVVLVDSLQGRVHPNGPPDDLPVPVGELHVRDVREGAMWRELLPQCDAVLHLAAYQDYQPDYSTFLDVNVTSTALLYEVANEIGWSGQVVVASSSATLGEGAYSCATCGIRVVGRTRTTEQLHRGRWNIMCDGCGNDLRPEYTDESEWFPITPYGVSKQGEEQTALTVGRLLDVPTVALRYSIVQGPGQSPWNAYSGVMRATCLQILAGGDVIVFEDGGQLRDYVSIFDVVDANVRALRGEVPPGGYHVGGGSAHSVYDLASSMMQIAGRSDAVHAPGWYRVGDVRHTVSDITKLTTASSWRPHASTVMTDTWQQYWSWLSALNLPARDIVDQAFGSMKASGVLCVASEW